VFSDAGRESEELTLHFKRTRDVRHKRARSGTSRWKMDQELRARAKIKRLLRRLESLTGCFASGGRGAGGGLKRSRARERSERKEPLEQKIRKREKLGKREARCRCASERGLVPKCRVPTQTLGQTPALTQKPDTCHIRPAANKPSSINGKNFHVRLREHRLFSLSLKLKPKKAAKGRCS